MNLVALKALRYGTRRLLPGEHFEVKDRHVGLLVRLKRAALIEQRPVGEIPAPPERLRAAIQASVPAPSAVITDTELPALRTEYFEKLGKRPFMGWNAQELRRRMAESAES